MADYPLLLSTSSLEGHSEIMPLSVASWLLDPGSMTERLKRSCRELSIKIHFEGFLAADTLGEEVVGLPPASKFWLRESQMEADGVPWLYCRALAPQSVLDDGKLDLARLGTVPLGAKLFSRSLKPQRDSMEIFAIEPPSVLQKLIGAPATCRWWMRRSRLLAADYAIVITEVFLPATPFYGL